MKAYQIFANPLFGLSRFLSWEEAKSVFEKMEKDFFRGVGEYRPVLYHNGKEVNPYHFGIGLKWEEDHASGLFSSVGVKKEVR